MALHPLRLRRALTTVTSLHRALSASYSTARLSSIPIFQLPASDSISSLPASPSRFTIFQSRSFRSSASLLSSSQYKLYKEGDEITPDTVLFEGCDFNHWLITVDFPKDPKPSPEEMVRTYEEICAKGLGISIEEAKKKIYACSTTTYEGFQAIMTEEESKKFENIPGVVFVLPDSYIDPANKEYGGDKYENGVITHRPPPVQYNRNQGGRYRDRNRNFNQQRFDQRGSFPNQQGIPPHSQQGPMQGDGRNYGPPQNYPPQQNYGPQQPMNNPSGRGPMPSYQGNYNQGGQGNYYPQEQRNFPQGEQRNYAQQRVYGGDSRDHLSTQSVNFRSGANPGYGQNYQGYGVGQGGSPGYGQGATPSYGQNYGQGRTPPGPDQSYGQGTTPGYGQGYAGQGSPGLPQGELRSEQGASNPYPSGKQ
ncbi:hypothetical protein SLE2022_044320 [Rubroshorea leprosula]